MKKIFKSELKKMLKLKRSDVEKIPNIFKCDWFEKWIEEQKKPMDYLGRLAILVEVQDGNKKKSQWITEGVDFIIEE